MIEILRKWDLLNIWTNVATIMNACEGLLKFLNMRLHKCEKSGRVQIAKIGV